MISLILAIDSIWTFKDYQNSDISQQVHVSAFLTHNAPVDWCIVSRIFIAIYYVVDTVGPFQTDIPIRLPVNFPGEPDLKPNIKGGIDGLNFVQISSMDAFSVYGLG